MRHPRRAGALVAALVVVSTAAVATPGSGPAAGQPWDLVYISDSSGWGVARFYARQITEDRGAAVRVHDKWEMSLSTDVILDRLRTPSHHLVRLVRDAEVIVVYGNPEVSETPGHPQTGGNCMGDGRRPISYGPKTWTRYIADLKAIYRQVFELRKGRPVILRTANWAMPIIGHGPTVPPGPSWEESGITDACTAAWEMFAWAVSKAAIAYRVPVADVYTAFNGSGHREDPVEKGYIQGDNVHPNNAGRAVIAETLAALGYERVQRPR